MTVHSLRRVTLSLGATLISLLCLAPFGAAQTRRQIPLPTEAVAQRFGLMRKWFAYVPVDGLRERVERISIANGILFVQTDGSHVHALDAETGRPLWTVRVGRPIRGQFGVAVNSSAAFAINGTMLYKLNLHKGSIDASYELAEPVITAPIANDETVVICTANGRVYNYFAAPTGPQPVRWYYQTNAPVSVPAQIHDDKIIAASEDGMLYAIGINRREPIFRYRTDAPVTAAVAVSGLKVFLASQDYNIYAIDVRTGETYWRFTAGGPIRRPLVVVDDHLYVTPDDNGLHCLNCDTGERLWWHPRASHFVAASGTRIYAGDRFGQLLLIDRRTGQELGTWDTNAFQHRVQNDGTDRVYLATNDGLIVCMHEKSQKDPIVRTRKEPPAPAKAGGAPAPKKDAAAEGESK